MGLLLTAILIVVVGWIVIQALQGSHARGSAEAKVQNMSSKQLADSHHIATGYIAAARLKIIDTNTHAIHESIAMAHETLRRAAFESDGVPPREKDIADAVEINIQKWIKNIEYLPDGVKGDLSMIFSSPGTILTFGRKLGIIEVLDLEPF